MERRKIEELITLHILEPTLRDIIVEGESDQRLFRWYASGAGVVRTIGTIEVDDALLVNQGRKANNRERVILAAELAEQKAPGISSLLCVIDRDYDDYLEPRPLPSRCITTDFTCVEMYAWHPQIIAHFLSVFCGRVEVDEDDILRVIASPLQELFAIRLVGERSPGIDLDWIGSDRYVKAINGELQLDRKRFVLALLQKIGKAGCFQVFLDAVEAALAEFGNDPRMQIHGHDLTLLLKVWLKELGVQRDLLNVVVLSHGLTVSITAKRELLADHFVFRTLAQFCSC